MCSLFVVLIVVVSNKQVQLIMGKTLVDRLGEEDARVLMRGVKRGQVGLFGLQMVQRIRAIPR